MPKMTTRILTLFDMDVHELPESESYDIAFQHIEGVANLSGLLDVCKRLDKELETYLSPRDEEVIGLVIRKKDNVLSHHDGVVMEKTIHVKKIRKVIKKRNPTVETIARKVTPLTNTEKVEG